MRTCCLIATMLGLLAPAGAYAQQGYPTRPIRLIVPFPAGGQTDIMARTLSHRLGEAFKETVVVDNRPGGGGTIGPESAVKANPDGYTLIMVSASYSTNAALYKLPYDPVNDVTPISLIGETGFVVTVQLSSPVKSTKELIAYAKAHPGQLNYASGGTGSSTHFATELFNQMAGVSTTHVPYKGTGQGLTDLLAGNIQLVFAGFNQMLPHIKANRVRGLSVTTARRASALPDLPTVADTVAGYEAVQWFAVWGPKGLPRSLVTRWNGELNRALQLPDVKERMAADGVEPVGGSPERFREALIRDVAKWKKVVSTAGIKVGS
ncbi:MAG TPA: tripartite tricarboxylate transporter substrate binding protein [Burkholderiales bacterium]|nr:tripartite tricarboxylate transporter substrate binding protein [Burkholderiales bacterium]